MVKFTKSPGYRKHVHSFDIDNYLNWVVPRNRLDLLPVFLSHWLGYRTPNSAPRSPPSAPTIWLSAAVGGFIGIAVISNVYQALPLLEGHQAPTIIASFGAAAILEYNTIESPLSQPRNLIVGHAIAAVIGVGITQGFERLPPARFEQLRWLAGALSVGVASAAMSITKTIHPPAGATALLASTTADITVLGWWLVPLVLLASCLMTASALLVNNLTRRWPLYWWTPADLSKKARLTVEHVADIEKQEAKTDSDTDADSLAAHKAGAMHKEDTADSASKSDTTTTVDRSTLRSEHEEREHQVTITDRDIILPDWWEANDWEQEILAILQLRLKQRARGEEPTLHHFGGHFQATA